MKFFEFYYDFKEILNQKNILIFLKFDITELLTIKLFIKLLIEVNLNRKLNPFRKQEEEIKIKNNDKEKEKEKMNITVKLKVFLFKIKY
jgi:hypothetical protein